MEDEIRKHPNIFAQSSIDDLLNEMDRTTPGKSAAMVGHYYGGKARFALYVNAGGGWSFAGFMEHEPNNPLEAGVVVRKSW